MIEVLKRDLARLEQQREQVIAQINAINGTINYIKQKIAEVQEPTPEEIEAMDRCSTTADASPETAKAESDAPKSN